MKQKLKISIGSSLQKAATCLTVAATIAALSISFSCSSDNDYEEPWLNKEHRTRAVSSTSSTNEEVIDIRGKKIKAGATTIILENDPLCEVDVYWSGGWVEAGSNAYPKSTISVCGGRVCEGATAFFSIPSYRLDWMGQDCRICGTIAVSGTYVPLQHSSVWKFSYEQLVSQRVHVELDDQN